MVPCKPTFAITHHLISNRIVSKFGIVFCKVGTLGNLTHVTSKLFQEPTKKKPQNKQEKHILITSSLTYRIYINKVLYIYSL